MTPLAKGPQSPGAPHPLYERNRIILAAIALAVVIVTTGVILYLSWPRMESQETVPDVAGMSRTDAEEALYDRGRALGTITNGIGTPETVGLVIEQKPAASTVVAPLTEVDLVIGALPSRSAGVPAVTGLVAIEAAGRIREAGLKPVQVDQFSSRAPIGTVLGQYPWGNASTYLGDDVVIIVSAGSRARAVIMPQVVGTTEDGALGTLDALELQTHVSYTSENTNTPTSNVVRQFPAPGETVPPKGTVAIVVPR